MAITKLFALNPHAKKQIRMKIAKLLALHPNAEKKTKRKRQMQLKQCP